LFKTKSKPFTLEEYPSGVCVKTDTGYWYIQGKYKRKIPSKRIFLSWSFPFVILVTDESLANLVRAKSLGFRDGTMVRAMDGTVFLISERQRRRVTNPDFLKATGTERKQIPVVSDKELALHELGKDLE